MDFLDPDKLLSPTAGVNTNPEPAGTGAQNNPYEGGAMADQAPSDASESNENTGGDEPVLQPHVPSASGGVTGTGEQFTNDGFTGTGGLTIGGLSYSTAAGNGEYGFGFGPAGNAGISRRTSHHTPTYNDDRDEFVMGPGVLVPLLDANNESVIHRGDLQATDIDGQSWIKAVTASSNGNFPYRVRLYRPRIEAAFNKIQYWTWDSENDPGDNPVSFWQIITGNNEITLFGVSASARVSNPGDNSQVFKWLLEETLDASGHCSLNTYLEENTDGVNTESPNERNRVQTAQRYMDRSFSGHKEPIPEPLSFLAPTVRSDREPAWYFITACDYGQYNIDPTNNDPYDIPAGSEWGNRQDSFSTFIAGFEIRTHRLCRNRLTFHQFEELGDRPRLRNVTTYHYDGSPIRTLLKAVQPIGYYYHADEDRYHIKNSVPQEVDYTTFEPTGRSYREVLHKDSGKPLSSIGNQLIGFIPVDLYGEGIPGLLHSDGDKAQYLQTDIESIEAGEGEPLYYSETARNLPLPAQRLQVDNLHQFMDFTGNGRLDYVVNQPTQFGYYEAQEDFTWDTFYPVPAFGSEQFNADRNLVDITGNGRPDCVMVLNQQVRYYENHGVNGFGDGRQVVSPNLPDSIRSSEDQLFTFLDIAGDGKGHLVRVNRDGLTWWPNYGYGAFGAPVTMTNFPEISYNEFRTDRIYFSDLDGTGTADMILLTATGIRVYLNQAGNSFSEAMEIDLPEGTAYDPLDRIQFADVLGNGTSCMIYCQSHLAPRQWVYDFCGGVKPYLLNRHYNNLGSETETTYRSSVHYYLEDQAEGIEWFTRAPFPTWVVANVQATDAISRSVLSTEYGYRHSYYDGIEREFRGFGRVSQRDTMAFDSSEPDLDSPPMEVISWFHSGNDNQEAITQLYIANEYYAGDDLAQHLNPCRIIDNEGNPITDPQTYRDGQMLLKGELLHREVYGLDDTADADNPFSVTESNATMLLIQSVGPNYYASFERLPWETLGYNYERNPEDPAMKYSAALHFDEYGHLIQECSVIYPRRNGFADPDAGSEQETVRCYSSVSRVHNLTDGSQIGTAEADDEIYLLGLNYEMQKYVVTNLATVLGDPGNGQLYAFSDLESVLTANNPETGDPFAPEVDAALVGWSLRNLLYPIAGTSDPADSNTSHIRTIGLGRPGNRALLLPDTTESAVNDEAGLATLFSNYFTQANLATTLSEDGKFYAQNGYWWAKSGVYTYGTAEVFYTPEAYTDTMGTETTMEHDQYHLIITRSTDALGNVTQVNEEEIDYQTIQSKVVIDPNDNKLEAMIDPLARPIAGSRYGGEREYDPQTQQWNYNPDVGFSSLFNLDGRDEPYTVLQPQSMLEVVEHPYTYLQQASNYIFYSEFSWMGRVSVRDYEAIDGVTFDPADLENWVQALATAGLSNSEGAIYHQLRELLNAAGNANAFAQELLAISAALYDQFQVFDGTQQQAIFTALSTAATGQPAHLLTLTSRDYPGNSNAIVSAEDYHQRVSSLDQSAFNAWWNAQLDQNLIDAYGTINASYATLIHNSPNLATFKTELANVSADLLTAFELFPEEAENEQQSEVWHLLRNAVYERVYQSIGYTDGFGRNVLSKVKAGDGVDCFLYDSETGTVTKNTTGEPVSNRWLTTGHTVYNNKGEVVRQYDPYYINTPLLVDSEALYEVGTSPTNYYDALGRTFRIISSKGLLVYRTWTPWEQTVHSPADTFLLSPFYQVNEANIWNDDNTPPDPSDPWYPYFDEQMDNSQRAVYRKSVVHAFTPGRTVLDNRGLTLIGVELNDAQYTAAGLETLGYSDTEAQNLFDQLVSKNLLLERDSYELEENEGENPVAVDITWGELTENFPIKTLGDLLVSWDLGLQFSTQGAMILSVLYDYAYTNQPLAQDALFGAFVTAFGRSPFDAQDCEALWDELVIAGVLDSSGNVSITFPDLGLDDPFAADNNMIFNYMVMGWAQGDVLKTWSSYDELGRPVTIADPRLHENGFVTMRYTYPGAIGAPAHVYNCDAGETLGLVDALGRPLWSVDARGTVTLPYYDVLHRVTQIDVQLMEKGTDGGTIIWGPVPHSRIGYGESQFGTDPTDYNETQRYNYRGKPVQTFTQGLWSSVVEGFTFNGQPNGGTSLLTRAYKSEEPDPFSVPVPLVTVPDLGTDPTTPNDPNDVLQPASMAYNALALYDAAGEAIEAIDAAGFVHRSRFLQSGGLRQLKVDDVNYLDNVEYNAKKQQISSDCYNDAGELVYRTYYGYDAQDYTLRQIYATTQPDEVDRTSEYEIITTETDNTRQNLVYALDPMMNVGQVDGQYQGPYEEEVDGEVVEEMMTFPAGGEYTYDALGRLIVATGYEDDPQTPSGDPSNNLKVVKS